MPTLNLGILAHVDAGKTTLTERLLYQTGATRHLGRVDHGDTTTDSDSIERRRGITIRSAVVAFTVPTPDGPLRVNLIDTPGHSDFVAEVERCLAVLDGAVLVVSAVEGVQAQTRVLIRTLERLRLPFLVFVNKVDRAGASRDGTLAVLAEVLSGSPVALTPTLSAEDVVDAVTPWDDRLLRDYVHQDRPPGEQELLSALAEQARLGHVHPVLFGSALQGVGVTEVLSALTTFLPTVEGRGDEPLHATVFKIDRDAGGHRIGYVRIHEGRLASRDHVTLHRRTTSGTVVTHEARALEVRTFDRGADTRTGAALAGDIATVLGLGEIAIGDQLGRWDPARAGRHFPDPGLESVVEARDPDQRTALFQALRQLSEQDPLIDARLDGPDEEVTVTVYGEVQKEVLAARLVEEYDVVADFLPTRVVHVERVSGTGEDRAVSPLGNVNVGLRVGPAPAGTGLDYGLAAGVERGWLLPQFHHAVEEQLRTELAEGLHGWRIADLDVRTVHSRWGAPTPSPSDFRRVTHRAFRQALAAAGTVVCAPVSRFELEVPAEALSRVLGALVAAGATPEPLDTGPTSRVVGTLPTEQVATFEQRLPGYTSGRGVFWSEPYGYVPVTGPPPSRGSARSTPPGASRRPGR